MLWSGLEAGRGLRLKWNEVVECCVTRVGLADPTTPPGCQLTEQR